MTTETRVRVLDAGRGGTRAGTITLPRSVMRMLAELLKFDGAPWPARAADPSP